MREERSRTRLLVLNSHAERRKSGRAAESAVFIEEDGHLAGNGRGLQHDRAKLRERADQFGGEGAHALDADNLRVGGGGGLEFQVRRSLVALSAELD